MPNNRGSGSQFPEKQHSHQGDARGRRRQDQGGAAGGREEQCHILQTVREKNAGKAEQDVLRFHNEPRPETVPVSQGQQYQEPDGEAAGRHGERPGLIQNFLRRHEHRTPQGHRQQQRQYGLTVAPTGTQVAPETF